MQVRIKLRTLKEFNYVSRGVLAENLFATPLIYDVVLKFHATGFEL